MSTSVVRAPVHCTITSGLSIKTFATGVYHVLILTNSGEVYGYGGNSAKQLGSTASGSQVTTLVRMGASIGSIVDIAAGSSTSYIVMDDGSAYSVGSNRYVSAVIFLHVQQLLFRNRKYYSLKY